MTKTWWNTNKQVTPNNNNVIVGKNAHQSGNISGGSMINGATIETTVVGVEEPVKIL